MSDRPTPPDHLLRVPVSGNPLDGFRRPTPRELAMTATDPADYLLALEDLGYALAHPDDVPERYHWDGITMQRCINDDCRADHLIWDFDIFGGSHE